jgi:hypothetical protein
MVTFAGTMVELFWRGYVFIAFLFVSLFFPLDDTNEEDVGICRGNSRTLKTKKAVVGMVSRLCRMDIGRSFDHAASGGDFMPVFYREGRIPLEKKESENSDIFLKRKNVGDT